MKTMKYRSVFGTLCAAALSVFLFTACEKESDGISGSTNKDRLEKFKRLQFTGSGAETSTSSTGGSGTFSGTGSSSISYTPPTGGNGPGNGATWAPTTPNEAEFTDPMSTGPVFAVSTPFSSGGGAVTFGNKSYDLNFGFCASSDIFGSFSPDSANSESDLEVFIGVSGDFDISMAGEDEPDDLGIGLILYVFSYGGSSQIGSFENFEEGSAENSAFVMVVEFEPGEDEDAVIHFAKSGTVDFSGSTVTLSNVQMAKVIETMIEPGQYLDELSSNTKKLDALLECFQFDFEEEE